MNLKIFVIFMAAVVMFSGQSSEGKKLGRRILSAADVIRNNPYTHFKYNASVLS